MFCTQAAFMQLINAIISTPEVLDFRLQIRNEIMQTGLVDILGVSRTSTLCRAWTTVSHRLQTISWRCYTRVVYSIEYKCIKALGFCLLAFSRDFFKIENATLLWWPYGLEDIRTIASRNRVSLARLNLLLRNLIYYTRNYQTCCKL